MKRFQKRVMILASALMALIIASAFLYMAGMAVLEGEPRRLATTIPQQQETT